MSMFLAGIPGQVKTLLDRLTSARAAKIDNLDATVTSRAPSSTAVSNTNYTSARATKLDQLDAAVSSRAAASTAVSSSNYTAARASKLDNLDNLDAPVSGIKGIPKAASTGSSGSAVITATSFTTVVSVSGSGMLCYIRAWGEDDLVQVAGQIRVTADGVNVWGDGLDVGGVSGNPQEATSSMVIQLSSPIVFNSSLVIAAKAAASSSDVNVVYAVLKS